MNVIFMLLQSEYLIAVFKQAAAMICQLTENPLAMICQLTENPHN